MQPDHVIGHCGLYCQNRRHGGPAEGVPFPGTRAPSVAAAAAPLPGQAGLCGGSRPLPVSPVCPTGRTGGHHDPGPPAQDEKPAPCGMCGTGIVPRLLLSGRVSHGGEWALLAPAADHSRLAGLDHPLSGGGGSAVFPGVPCHHHASFQAQHPLCAALLRQYLHPLPALRQQGPGTDLQHVHLRVYPPGHQQLHQRGAARPGVDHPGSVHGVLCGAGQLQSGALYPAYL